MYQGGRHRRQLQAEERGARGALHLRGALHDQHCQLRLLPGEIIASGRPMLIVYFFSFSGLFSH